MAELSVVLPDSQSRLPAPFWCSAILAVPALALYLWTLLLIRTFHPRYPGFVDLGLFMPPRPVHFAHSVFPLAFTVMSAFAVVVAVRTMRNRRPIKPTGYAILIAHWVALIVFTVLFLWAAGWAAGAQASATP